MLETSFQSAITISLICLGCCCCYCVASRSQKIYGAASGMGPVFNYHILTPLPTSPSVHSDPRRCNWIWFGIRIWLSVWVCFRICIECKLIFRFSRASPNWQYVRQLMDERENARGKLTLSRGKVQRGLELCEKLCEKRNECRQAGGRIRNLTGRT